MKKLVFPLLILAFAASCKKEVNELPPATQTGANTFGARVNNDLWVPQGFGPFPADNLLTVVKAGNDIKIRAQNLSRSPNETEFDILIKGVTQTGTYFLNTDVTHPSSSASYAYFVKRNLTPQNEWITSSAYSGTVIITRIDTVNHVVSGTFQLNMLNTYNSPEPLTVTDGRFDLTIE